MVAAVWLGAAPLVWACSCMKLRTEQLSAKADVVFVGQVEQVGPDDTEYHVGEKYIIKANQVTATVAVRSQHKGTVGERVKVNTAASDAACGYPFEAGREYLIYATVEPTYVGEFHTGLCAGTKPLREAAEDLRALGAL